MATKQQQAQLLRANLIKEFLIAALQGGLAQRYHSDEVVAYVQNVYDSFVECIAPRTKE